MYQKNRNWESCLKTLEDNGGFIADKATKILLDDPALKDLHEPLEFVSKNWRDPLRPALMALSCESVGGDSNNTHNAALAISLMNLSFYLWDDIIDKAPSRMFKPTLVGKFGENTALIVGGLASAKAFTILNQANTDKEKQQKVTKLMWNHWTKVAQAETLSLKSRGKNYTSEDKFLKIEMEAAANLGICMKIGAVLGNGSESAIEHLGLYGKCLAIIIDLRNDLRVTLNLTLELDQKIATGTLPYSLLRAKEHSVTTAELLEEVVKKKQLDPEDAQTIVASVMETKVLKRIKLLTNRLTKKAVAELHELQQNTATQTLKSLVEAQLQLLTESLR
jgi:geranylgeranyl pyrophosphate synthase